MLGATSARRWRARALTVTAPRNLIVLAAVLMPSRPSRRRSTGDVPTRPPTRRPTPPRRGGGARPRCATVWADRTCKRLLLLAIVGPGRRHGRSTSSSRRVVSHQVPRASLAPFFARYNMVVNAAALAFQLLVAPRLLQSVTRGPQPLPAARLPRHRGGGRREHRCRSRRRSSCAARTACSGTRFIVPRPRSSSFRCRRRHAARCARLAESVGQRGGQVVGSLLILLALVLGATPRELSAASPCSAGSGSSATSGWSITTSSASAASSAGSARRPTPRSRSSICSRWRRWSPP